MQLSVVSWNGSTDINNNADFTAWFDVGALQAAERDALYVDRAQLFPKLSGARAVERQVVMKIRCLGTIHSQRETIKKYFSQEDYTLRTLVVADTADSSRQWYVKGYAIRVNEETPGTMAVTIALDEPYWRTVAESTGSWSITATGQSTDFTVIGNMQAHPQLMITPTAGKTGSYAYKRWHPIYNKASNTFSNYPVDVGGLDTAALVSGNKMQSAGQDYRVRVDGREVDRWFAASTDTRKMNTTDTAVWINVDLPPKATGLLLTAIASTDTVTTITLDATPDNSALIRTLSTANNKCFLIDSEAFTYTNVTTPLLRIDGVSQAAKGTTQASHSAGATIRHIPYDVWTVYGSSDASAQTVDDTKKPMISPDSTNTSWIWYEFSDSTSPRSAQWSSIKLSGATSGTSGFYTATENTNANPSTVGGMKIQSYYQYGVPKPDTAEVTWQFNHPAGFTNVAVATGKKYRYSTSWPTTAGLQYFNNSTRQWTTAHSVSSPTATQTWESWTLASTDAGYTLGATYNLIKFTLNGTVLGSANNLAGLEIDAVTGVLDSNNVPNVAPNAEIGMYALDAKITNTTTGEWIKLNYQMAVDRTLTVDCDAKTITYDDGTNARASLTLSSNRTQWLDLSVGANTLQWDETALTATTVGVEWENRNTL